MKRSEMIAKFIAQADKDDDDGVFLSLNSKEDMVIHILDILESLGMLPPVIEGEATHKIKSRCKWEPES